MTQKDQVFITNVVVINSMREKVALNVNSRLTCAITKLSAIDEIHKYRKLHERHHFIPMAMKVHNAPRCDMDCFIRECAHLFHNRQSKGYLSLSFCIQFFKQHVSIVSQHDLAFTIERKIVLVSDVYSKPPITIKSHDLFVGDIKGVVGEIVSYHKKD
jgi:hypothetical protein